MDLDLKNSPEEQSPSSKAKTRRKRGQKKAKSNSETRDENSADQEKSKVNEQEPEVSSTPAAAPKSAKSDGNSSGFDKKRSQKATENGPQTNSKPDGKKGKSLSSGKTKKTPKSTKEGQNDNVRNNKKSGSSPVLVNKKFIRQFDPKQAPVKQQNNPKDASSKQQKTPKQSQRNEDFPPHYINEMVQQAIAKNLLVCGTLRINPRAFEDAFISTNDYNDVLITGFINRNRALNGDEVAVDILPESEWRILHETVAAFIDEDLDEVTEEMNGLKVDDNVVEVQDLSECDDSDNASVESDVVIEEVIELDEEGDVVAVEQAASSSKTKKTRRGKRGKNKSCNNEKEFTLEQIKKLPNWQRFVQKSGRVVAILEYNHSRKAVGYIRPRPGDNKYALFSPTDSRIPRILIPRDNLPEEFWQRQQDFANTLFATAITRWEKPKFAMGKLSKTYYDLYITDIGTSGAGNNIFVLLKF